MFALRRKRWKMVKLSKIITQVRGVSYKPNDVILEKKAGYTCLLRANNIDRGELKFDDVVYVDSARVKNTQLLRAEDILICASSGSRHLVGKAACVIGDMNVTFGAFCKVIRPLAEYAPFLGWFFKSPRYRMQISNASAGVNINNIRAEDIDNMEIDLLTVKQREEAVRKLNAITHLISLRQRQAEKLDELVKARFVEMFGNLRKNDKNWPMRSLVDFAKIDTQMIHDLSAYEDYPHIGIDSIEKGTGHLSGYHTVKEDGVISGKYLFTPKHIIYSKIRPNLNKVALPDFTGVCSADAYPILPESKLCDRVFLAYVMRSELFLSYILAFANRTNLPKVNKKQVEGFSCPLPPLPLQNAFATFVHEVDREKEHIQRSAALLETLKRSLMQQYFG